ncbi:MAG TPA: hypothetical protein VFG51_02355 [Candidatus Saccharimonadia bacterium]|nr:hypothetical protein [Candidatus Saccharimonadia bacterium]
MTTDIVEYLGIDKLPLQERVARVQEQYPKLDHIDPHDFQRMLEEYLLQHGMSQAGATGTSNRMVGLMAKNKLPLSYMAAAFDKELYIPRGKTRIPGWGKVFTDSIANFFADKINEIGK